MLRRRIRRPRRNRGSLRIAKTFTPRHWWRILTEPREVAPEGPEDNDIVLDAVPVPVEEHPLRPQLGLQMLPETAGHGQVDFAVGGQSSPQKQRGETEGEARKRVEPCDDLLGVSRGQPPFGGAEDSPLLVVVAAGAEQGQMPLLD